MKEAIQFIQETQDKENELEVNEILTIVSEFEKNKK